MKVYYKLDVNDIKQLIAEKYGVSTKGIGTCMTPEGTGFMVDMSRTETPEPVPFKDYVSPFLAGKEEPAEEKKRPVGGLTPETRAKANKIAEEKAEEYGIIPPEKKEPEQQDSIPTEVVSDLVYQELQYKKITNERLQEYIEAGRTIPQICKAYELTDSKYSAKLYKRAEQFRKEGARLGRRSNKEKAKETEQSAG